MASSPQAQTTSRLPAPFGLYYGWVMAAGAAAMNFSVSAMSPGLFSFFIIAMTSEFGWSRSEMTLAFTFRLLVAGLSGPVLGRLLDRLGSRWLGVAGGIIAGTSVILLSTVSELWQLYLLYAVSGATGIGGPAGNLFTTVPIAKWFVAKRGRAMAIAQVGMPAGVVFAIPLGQQLIQNVGWRPTWVVLGIMLIVVVCTVSGVIMRRTPEDYGLHPDGADREPASAPSESQPTAAYEEQWALGEAVRTRTFWLIVLALTINSFVLSGTLVNRIPFWQDVGLPLTLLSFSIALDPLTVVCSSLLFGFLGERLSVRFLGLIGGAGLALSMLPMILFPTHPASVGLHAVIWGAAVGANIAVGNLTLANYFGRRSLGAIQGVVLPATILSNAFGAPFYGLLFDRTVPSDFIWLGSVAGFLATGILLSLARRPQRLIQQAGH